MVVCGGQGGLGDKDEDKGVVNWKLLPGGIGHHWVGFAARAGGVAHGERVTLLLGGPLQHLVDPGLPAWTCSLEILENGR
jgi:hypothetical protein